MALTYPGDYPFNVDNEGWPASVYAPPYPFEHYHDNGRNSHEIDTTSEINNDDHHRLNYNSVLPLSIRRHTPGSTDPNVQQLSSRNHSRTSNFSFTVKQNLSQSNRYSTSIRHHSPASLDSDERPIKPMKDTSVYNYNKPSTQKKIIQPKKPSLPTPKKPSPPTPKTPSPPIPKPIQSSPRYEFDLFQSPPSRTQMNSVSSRRPVRTELIPKTPFGIPPQRNRPRPIIVEEYEDYPVTYIKHIPKKIISYQPVSGMTTRELENYQMSRRRRIVRIRSPPIETIIYRT